MPPNRQVPLYYPPEWKFESDGDTVPPKVVREVYTYAERIASGAPNEQGVVETFKSRFGDPHTSSSLSFAYGDLNSALESAAENGAIFSEGLWLAITDLKETGHVVPSLDQINKMFEKHNFQYRIQPPNLVRVESKSGTSASPSVPPPTFLPTLDPVAVKSALVVPPAAPKVPARPTLPPSAGATAATSTRTCFVAQPFKEPYQTRFAEDFKPAIEAAGLVAYKVDLDTSADRLIDDIEEAIRRAAAVLVDITLPNPNVWYELGFSQAMKKPLVMVACSNERPPEPFPFDVRGRLIIDYSSGTRGGLNLLQTKITDRLKALMEKEAQLERIEASPLLPTTDGVPPLALRVVEIMLAETPVPGETIALWTLQEELGRVVDGKTAVSMAIRLALRTEMIETTVIKADGYDDPTPGVRLTAKGERFIIDHQRLFETETPRRPKPHRGAGYGGGRASGPSSTGDDDIPF